MKFDPALHTKNTHPLPVFRVDSWGWRIVCPEQPARDFRFLLCHRLARLSRDQPVTIMVHGSGFSPFSNRADGQATIYARHLGPERWQTRCWPMRFASASVLPQDALMIGFGWNAIKSEVLSGPNNAALFEAATGEAKNLAILVNTLADAGNGRPINIVCHGLGARIIMRCFQHLTSNHINRVVIMSGHEFSANTLTALSHPNAKMTQFYNMRSSATYMADQRANADMPKSGPKDRLIALGFPFQRHNWLDVDTSRYDQRRQIMRGSSLPILRNRFCKWSFGPDRAIDDLIARIIHNAPNTSVKIFRDRLFELEPATEDHQSRYLWHLFHTLSPLRRRKAR
jgi:hypothetical protein